MPVTLMRFCLQGLSPRTEPSSSSEPGYPPGVSPRSAEASCFPRLQGLSPRREPTPKSAVCNHSSGRCLHGFSHSLGISPATPWPCSHSASPHELLRTPQLAPKRRTLSRVLRNDSVGSSLARLPPLMSFLRRFSNSLVRIDSRIGLMDSP